MFNFWQKISQLPRTIDERFTLLTATHLETVLGPMIAIADEKALYLLEFITKKGVAGEIARLERRGFAFVCGETPPLLSIKAELKAYFEGSLSAFKTPYQVLGTSFQQQVWQALCLIPYGETRSYAEQSASLNRPTAYRAVANANGANQLSIIIPCHRVIASDGTLGGYGSGLSVKQWLLRHEKQYINQ